MLAYVPLGKCKSNCWFFRTREIIMKYLRYITFSVIALLINTVTNASERQPIQSHTLKNGLTILVKEDHHTPAVISMIWYHVGSAYEYSGITGISHALEHMMFQGTPTYPEGQFSKIIAENGGEQNAFTSQDYTAYYQKLDHSLLPLAFKLESDRMQNLSLKAKNFSKEIQVVREERRMRTDDNPQALTYERFMGAAYLSTPYHNPVIGWPDDLQSLSIEDLRHWYHTWYAPNNATIVVVGDVKPKEVFKLAEQSFGKIPAKIIPPFKKHEEPVALGQRQITVKAPAQQPLIMMGYLTPSRVTEKESWKPYALTLLAGILSEGNSARLVKDLVRDKQIANETEAYYDMYSLYQSEFLLFGSPAEKHTIQQVKAGLLEEIDRIKNTLVSITELDKIKNQLIAQKLYAQDSISSQASNIGMLKSIGLPPNASDVDIKQLQAITPEQIQQVAQEYLTQDNLTIAILEPQALKPGLVIPNNNVVMSGALS
jgi:zinc protease